MKQINLGSWIGALKIVFGQVGQYVSYLTMALAGIGAYPVIISWGINVPVWMYVMILVGFVLVICLVEYVIGQPPTFSYWNQQWWKHDNPFRQDYEERMKRIEDKIDKLKEAN